MAGDPADLTIYIDTNYSHDHTYYGRGCKNGWGTSGEGGSQTPCADSDAGGRYVTTADGETQKNGTYFNFQAATVGAGGAMATGKTDSSYTFCPLGWQLPYSGTGGDYDDKSKSWNHLFKSYGLHIGDGTATDATKVKSYPFSYVYSGHNYWNTGRLYYQSSIGYYWSSTVVSSTDAYVLVTWSSVVRPAYSDNKAYGDAVRCVTRYYRPFIDGTVASVYVSGDDTKSLVQFKDENRKHDHTYYGMGCPNFYGQDGSTGSDIPCSTRIVQDGNGEDQKNGTYYSGQAGMTGSITDEAGTNYNSSDTFCPLGWQLPYGGSGGDYYDKSKSWKYLFTLYGENSSLPTGPTVQKYPHSIIGSGEYYWGKSRLYNQFGTSGGHYLTLTYGRQGESMSRLSQWNTISIDYVDVKFGETIRCGHFLASGNCWNIRSKNLEHLCYLRTRRDDVERFKRGAP